MLCASLGVAMTEEWIRTGWVRSINPARRELRIKPEPGRTHQFDGLDWIQLKMDGKSPLRCKVESSRVRESAVIVRLSAGVPRDTVALMLNAETVVLSEELKQSPDGRMDVSELMDMDVVQEGKGALGTITKIYSTKANDVVEVTRPDGTSFMLPVIDKVFLNVDLERDAVIVGDIAPFVVENED